MTSRSRSLRDTCNDWMRRGRSRRRCRGGSRKSKSENGNCKRGRPRASRFFFCTGEGEKSKSSGVQGLKKLKVRPLETRAVALPEGEDCSRRQRRCVARPGLRILFIRVPSASTLG